MDWRCSARRASRRLLHGLLLGADADAARDGSDEPRRDDRYCDCHRARETAGARRGDRAGRRLRFDRIRPSNLVSRTKLKPGQAHLPRRLRHGILYPPWSSSAMIAFSMKQLVRTVGAAICAMFVGVPVVDAQMMVDSFDGPVTVNEVASFRTYVQTLTPAPDNLGNNWAQGHSGEQTKAMGLVYEISGDTGVLNQMIRFCDAVLSERNDLAPSPVGQYSIWTGRVDPVWPNNVSSMPIGTGGEQGDPIGHLGNCARLLLTSSEMSDVVVPDGDPFGYGATYGVRALAYVWGADSALDGHVLLSLLDLS